MVICSPPLRWNFLVQDLLEGLSKRKWRVFHVGRKSTNPGSLFCQGKETFGFQDEVKHLGEEGIVKNVKSASIGTDKETFLRKDHRPDVNVAGFVADRCVSTIARMSWNLGLGHMSQATHVAPSKGRGNQARLFRRRSCSDSPRTYKLGIYHSFEIEVP